MSLYMQSLGGKWEGAEVEGNHGNQGRQKRVRAIIEGGYHQSVLHAFMKTSPQNPLFLTSNH